MKELLFDMQEEHRDDWISINYPEAEEGTPEWDAAAQDYSWFHEAMEDAAEQQYFEASLASIPDRHQEAKTELHELEQLLESSQPDIVLRMIFAHTVTVLESFLMYSARALLNHPPHLERFMNIADSLIRSKDARKDLLNPKWFEQEPGVDTPPNVFLWRAQGIVGTLTFQSHKAITRYFSAMLVTPHDWGTERLQFVIKTRNDLVHRNGITPNHEQVHIWPDRVKDTIQLVCHFIETAAATLLQEDARYRPDDDVF